MRLLPFALTCCACICLASPKHPYGPDDWASIRSAGIKAVSADGKTILYTVAWGGKSGFTNVEWRLANIDGSDAHKVEFPGGFGAIGFTADGKIFGQQDIKGVHNIAIYDISGLNAKTTASRMIPLPGSSRSIALSPDGSCFGVLVDPVAPDPLAGVHTVIQADHAAMYVVSSDGSGGKWWSPELQDVNAFAWAHDGRRVALLSVTPKIGFHYMRSWIDVCSDSSTKRIATIDNAASSIAWTGDDSEVLFTSTTTSVLTPDHLWSVEASGDVKPVDRTPDIDFTVMGVQGDPHGKVWVQVDKGVTNEIDSYDGGNLRLAWRQPQGAVFNLTTAQTINGPDQLVMDEDDSQSSTNVAVPGDGMALKRITSEGDAQLADIGLGPVKDIHWRSKEGIDLEGIATFPADYAPGRKYPFVVYPHGGPEGNDLLVLDTFARTLAGAGYIVIQPEYRGSTGYGTKFLNSIYQHFGDRAYRDVDSATDYAIAQGWADPNRLAIFGWSAGGFITSWTVTQTNRYKAAVEGAGITDWGSFMWTSDVQQFDYDARLPAKDPDAFAKFSAVMYADRVTTPLLILHGAADMRVPTYQGREYYETLLSLGKITRMVTYPGSGHFPSRWDQMLDVAHEMVGWLDKYDK